MSIDDDLFTGVASGPRGSETLMLRCAFVQDLISLGILMLAPLSTLTHTSKAANAPTTAAIVPSLATLIDAASPVNVAIGVPVAVVVALVVALAVIV